MSGELEGLSKSRKKLPVIVGLVVVAIVAVIALRGRHSAPEAKATVEPTISVKVVTLGTSSVPNEVSASGTVRPLVESKIAPKIMSNVAAVYVREGDSVRKGQVLIRLEARDLQAQVAQAAAALSAAEAGAARASTGVGLQKVQTSTGIAGAEAQLKAAREQLSLVQAGPRKQQRAQAHLAVAQAEAQFRNAQIDLDRYKRLYEQDVIAKQRLDSAQTAYDVAKAQYDAAKEQASMTEEGSRDQEIKAAQQQVRQAEEALRMAKGSSAQDVMSVRNAQVAASQVQQARATLEFARTQLGYATITSPISGVVSARMVDPGDTVSPGVPVIAVQAAANYRLEATVPEGSAADLYVGKTVRVTVGADERTSDGTVAVISPAGDPSSHKFVVKVDLPGRLRARSGEFGRISFAQSYSKGVIIPSIALHDEGGLPTVFIVDRQNRVRMQAVKVGRDTDGGVEILSGLVSGDRVIVANTGVLADGTKVRIEAQ